MTVPVTDVGTGKHRAPQERDTEKRPLHMWQETMSELMVEQATLGDKSLALPENYSRRVASSPLSEGYHFELK